ncbi:MAG: hypothetical protein ACYC9U_09480 [Nitrososphaerales archaeon]
MLSQNSGRNTKRLNVEVNEQTIFQLKELAYKKGYSTSSALIRALIRDEYRLITNEATNNDPARSLAEDTERRKSLAKKLGQLESVFACLTHHLQVPNLRIERDMAYPIQEGQIKEIRKAIFIYATEPENRTGKYKVPWSCKRIENAEGYFKIYNFSLEDLEAYCDLLSLNFKLEKIQTGFENNPREITPDTNIRADDSNMSAESTI